MIARFLQLTIFLMLVALIEGVLVLEFNSQFRARILVVAVKLFMPHWVFNPQFIQLLTFLITTQQLPLVLLLMALLSNLRFMTFH